MTHRLVSIARLIQPLVNMLIKQHQVVRPCAENIFLVYFSFQP
jgi:hypothetical protein